MKNTVGKDGLISKKFFHFQKNVPNHYPEHYPPKENMLKIEVLLGVGVEVKNFLRLSHL